MKKIAFIVSVFLLPRVCLAVCGEPHISFQGIQAPGDDEFIYMSTADYEKAIVEEDKGNNSFMLNNTMWECDDEQGCKHYTAVLAPSGHAWNKSKNIGERLYWCTGNWGDQWEPYNLTECDDNFYDSLKKNPSLERTAVNMNNTTDKTVYRIDSNGGKLTKFCYTNPERVKCLKVDGTVWADGKCQCLELNGKKREWNGATCIEIATSVSTPVTPSVPEKPTVPQKPVAPDDEKLPDQSEKPVETVKDEEEPKKYECDPVIMQLVYSWQIQYASDAAISAAIAQIIALCNTDNVTEVQFKTMFNQLNNMVNQTALSEAAASELTIVQNRAKSNIASAVSTLQDIESGLKLTVWRDEEGKFNTSRLLSDSIAGVVLGTAGGLITSNVVKKNQVENGFEDIQCTIGGQVVAGWGDEFRVGIQ